MLAGMGNIYLFFSIPNLSMLGSPTIGAYSLRLRLWPLFHNIIVSASNITLIIDYRDQ